jgi:hypothetical protein
MNASSNVFAPMADFRIAKARLIAIEGLPGGKRPLPPTLDTRRRHGRRALVTRLSSSYP